MDRRGSPRPASTFDHDKIAGGLAEELILSIFRAAIGAVAVEDARPQRLPYDLRFLLDDCWRTVDVKFDRHIHETGNIVFEERNLYPSGYAVDKWGRDDRLDAIMVVSSVNPEAHLIDLRRLRELVDSLIPTGRLKSYQAQNGGYVTEGVLVPLEECRRARAVLASVLLPAA